MLYFVNNLGAKYIADDWIILTSSGKIIPLPKNTFFITISNLFLFY